MYPLPTHYPQDYSLPTLTHGYRCVWVPTEGLCTEHDPQPLFSSFSIFHQRSENSSHTIIPTNSWSSSSFGFRLFAHRVSLHPSFSCSLLSYMIFEILEKRKTSSSSTFHQLQDCIHFLYRFRFHFLEFTHLRSVNRHHTILLPHIKNVPSESCFLNKITTIQYRTNTVRFSISTYMYMIQFVSIPRHSCPV